MRPDPIRMLISGDRLCTVCARPRPSSAPGMFTSVNSTCTSERVSRSLSASSALALSRTVKPASSSTSAATMRTSTSSSTRRITRGLSTDAYSNNESGREWPKPLKAFSSLGGVLERSGFLAARPVQGLRLVLVCVARGLDGSLGVGHQLADYRNEALTLSRMLVGVQDQGGLSQGAQIAHDLRICTLPQLDLARDRLFQLEVGHSAMG